MDILSRGDRSKVISEIVGTENKDRKRESLKRFEIYRERQDRYIREALNREFSTQTVNEMRSIYSINLCARIIDELASLYKHEPVRSFELPDGELSELEVQQCENLYREAKADVKLKQANRYYKLFDQCAIQVLPRHGVVDLRVLSPHHYDVIPSAHDPEIGEIYILSSYDKDYDEPSLPDEIVTPDAVNQKIGDPDDWRAKTNFIWWSKDFHFVTNSHGEILDKENTTNPIGRLPFVDIAGLKDFEYWVRYGSNIVQFCIDYGVLLSDTANINRLQGYSQAVIYSDQPPQSMVIGPNNVLHIPLNKNKEIQPRFEFASPSPDMGSSLELLETYLRLFLTSRGIDPKAVSGKLDSQRYASGIERLLAMIEKFSASQDDMDLFRNVETQVFDLMVAWSNEWQSVSDIPLKESLQLATINDKAYLNVAYTKPEMVQTKDEQENSVIKLMDAGLMSKKEAVMQLREVDEDKAIGVVEEIDGEAMIKVSGSFAETETEEPEVDGSNSDL